MVNKEFFGETKNIGFKREIPSKHEKFLKDIIAFSNSTGGQVIVGIEDETCIVYGIGEQSPFKLSDSISNMISDACTPQIEPDISIRTIEDKTVLVIDIAPGKFRPYHLANKDKEMGQVDRQIKESFKNLSWRDKVYHMTHFKILVGNMMRIRL